jgi:hypothetical protein
MPTIDLPDVGEEQWGPKVNTAITKINDAVDLTRPIYVNPVGGTVPNNLPLGTVVLQAKE